MRSSTLARPIHVSGLHACVDVCMCGCLDVCMCVYMQKYEIFVIIHWTLWSNFHFLDPPILHCLKAIKKLELCMHINAHCMCMHAHMVQFFLLLHP